MEEGEGKLLWNMAFHTCLLASDVGTMWRPHRDDKDTIQ